MYKRIVPQRVQHTSGYIIQIGSRYSIEYLDGDVTAEIKSDFGPITGIYPNTLVLKNKNGERMSISDEERTLIFNRIKDGMTYLNINYEVCK